MDTAYETLHINICVTDYYFPGIFSFPRLVETCLSVHQSVCLLGDYRSFRVIDLLPTSCGFRVLKNPKPYIVGLQPCKGHYASLSDVLLIAVSNQSLPSESLLENLAIL